MGVRGSTDCARGLRPADSVDVVTSEPLSVVEEQSTPPPPDADEDGANNDHQPMETTAASSSLIMPRGQNLDDPALHSSTITSAGSSAQRQLPSDPRTRLHP